MGRCNARLGTPIPALVERNIDNEIRSTNSCLYRSTRLYYFYECSRAIWRTSRSKSGCRLRGAINRGDAKAFAALFAEDADFVVITGKYLKGRDELVTYHTRLFSDDFQRSHLDVTSVAIRILRTDVAVARVATKRTENGGKEMRTSFPMFVLTKQGESWLIAAVQNTLTSGPPVPPVGTPNFLYNRPLVMSTPTQQGQRAGGVR